MTWRSTVRLTIFVLSIVGMTAALWVLLTKAAHGEFRAGTAGGLIFLYASTVIALVLSAAAAIKTLRHRLVFSRRAGGANGDAGWLVVHQHSLRRLS
jgi:hypothetical protein